MSEETLDDAGNFIERHDMSRFKQGPQGQSILGALQATEMIDSKPTLPAGE